MFHFTNTVDIFSFLKQLAILFTLKNRIYTMIFSYIHDVVYQNLQNNYTFPWALIMPVIWWWRAHQNFTSSDNNERKKIWGFWISELQLDKKKVFPHGKDLKSYSQISCWDVFKSLQSTPWTLNFSWPTSLHLMPLIF